MDKIYGLNELYGGVIEPGLCASCGACVGTCPYLTSFKGKTVKLHDCTVESGRCFAYCPMTFFDPDAASRSVFGLPHNASELGHNKQVVASRAKDQEISSAGQGGGTVTALMLTALRDKVIDAAVLTARPQGESFPRGIVATTVEEIVSCCGSRFVGSHTLAALKEALLAGHESIGVVGLPCQVRSLSKMALLDLKDENLKERIRLVIGLFCNWAFSARDFNAFLAERFGAEKVRDFDIPPPPADVLVAETSNGPENVPLDQVRSLIQPACNNCPDMTSEFADISVGMYEGRPGWNTLIIRTDLGAGLVGTALESSVIETDPFPDENLSHLKTASLNKRKRASDD